MVQVSRRGVIYPTMACNIECAFCYYRDLDGKTHQPLDKMMETLRRFRYYYELEYVDITGGEPTVFPGLREMVRFCAEIGLRPTVITNGQATTLYPQLIELGLEDLLISIHGLETDHDRAVGKAGAFARMTRTIDMLKEIGFGFRTNTVVTQFNYQSLPEFAHQLVAIGPRMSNFIVFNPHEETLWSGQSKVPFQVRYSNLAPYLKQAIDHLMSAGIWVNVRYLPLCFMKGYEKHVCNFRQWQFDPYEWEYKSGMRLTKDQCSALSKEARLSGAHGESDDEKLHNYLATMQVKGAKVSRGLLATLRHRIRGGSKANLFAPACSLCTNRLICDGIYPQYAKSFGVEEFAPTGGDVLLDPLHYRRQDMGWAQMKRTV